VCIKYSVCPDLDTSVLGQNCLRVSVREYGYGMNLTEALECFVLSQLAQRVFFTSLEEIEPTFSILAEALGETQDAVLLAYDELVTCNLAFSSSTTAMVVSPDRAVQNSILRQEHDVAERLASLSEARLLYQQLAGSKGASPQMEVYEGTRAVMEFLRTLSESTNRTIDTFAPGGAHTPSQIAESEANGLKMYQRGVKARTVYLDSVRNDRNTLAHAEWLSSQGSEARTVPKLPIRMIISDGDTAVLPYDANNALRSIAVYHNPNLVKALQELFELFWEISTPLGPTPITKISLGSETDRIILKMISQGKNDYQIGKKLGVSDRTVRRDIKNLLERISVTTRTEAVYYAAKNNWF